MSACEVPWSGRLSFNLPSDQIEIGLGIHGEPGARRGPLLTADEIAAILVDAILTDVGRRSGHEFALLVNGLGATACLDSYVLYGAARRELERAGSIVTRSLVGEYITSLEMAGASLSVTTLDDELRELIDAPTQASRFVR